VSANNTHLHTLGDQACVNKLQELNGRQQTARKTEPGW
jgi:hypothetical protein